MPLEINLQNASLTW